MGLCLLVQAAAAAPSQKPKTAIIPFKSSPFPYDGRPMPGKDQPFFDVEQDGRRGHTSPRGGIYWEDITYSDRSVLLHIPASFNPNRPGVMVVYFHGNQAILDRDVRLRQKVPRQVAQSGLNAVLVAPQFAVDALDSTGGRFHEPRAFRGFIEEACRHLGELYGNKRAARAFDALPVVIVAYSGGYYPLASVLRHGGIGDRLRGIVLLDALYSDLDKFVRWIEVRESAFFFSAYSRSTKDANVELQRLLAERNVDFATTVPGRLAPGSVTFVAASEEVKHKDFVTEAWVADPLRSVLAKAAGLFRPPPAKSRRR
jgi:hypothetical protein